MLLIFCQSVRTQTKNHRYLSVLLKYTIFPNPLLTAGKNYNIFPVSMLSLSESDCICIAIHHFRVEQKWLIDIKFKSKIVFIILVTFQVKTTNILWFQLGHIDSILKPFNHKAVALSY